MHRQARLVGTAKGHGLVIREERETKAADPLKVCTTVRVTLFHLVPEENRKAAASNEEHSIEVHP